jgi:hypothetical protein
MTYNSTAPKLPLSASPKSRAFYAWLTVLTSGSFVALIVMGLLVALVTSLATANSGDVNILFVGVFLAALSFPVSAWSAATTVLGIILVAGISKTARDRAVGVVAIVIGSIGFISPVILMILASRNH